MSRRRQKIAVCGFGLGGLVYGIPEFRLPKAIVLRKGVQFKIMIMPLAQTTPGMQFNKCGSVVVESENTGRTTKKGVGVRRHHAAGSLSPGSQVP